VTGRWAWKRLERWPVMPFSVSWWPGNEGSDGCCSGLAAIVGERPGKRVWRAVEVVESSAVQSSAVQS
jgi:hypothetical protein